MKNLFDIKDKVIIVTGGCGILGKSIANYLAEQGAKIVILDRVEEIGKELTRIIQSQRLQRRKIRKRERCRRKHGRRHHRPG